MDGRTMEVLSQPECLALLATVPVGRIVFTDRALPAVQPVNFVVDDATVVIRTAADSRLATDRGVIVAFEVDQYDPETRTGWYVTVTGPANHIRDPDEIARLASLPLHPWAPGQCDHFIRIYPELVDGRRINPATQGAVGCG